MTAFILVPQDDWSVAAAIDYAIDLGSHSSLLTPYPATPLETAGPRVFDGDDSTGSRRRSIIPI